MLVKAPCYLLCKATMMSTIPLVSQHQEYKLLESSMLMMSSLDDMGRQFRWFHCCWYCQCPTHRPTGFWDCKYFETGYLMALFHTGTDI
jgi:hypothetical protein